MTTRQLPFNAIIFAALTWGPPGPPCPAAPPLVHGDWQTFTVDDGLPHDSVLSVHTAGEQVWVGTEGGLARFDGESWTNWTVDDGLPVPAISAIDFDPRTRDVWLGTWGGGLVRFTGGRFDQFGQLNSGLAGNLVFAVAVAEGTIWAATNGGLCAYDIAGDSWDLHFERRADRDETAITGLCLDGGLLRAAAWCEGVWELGIDTGDWSRVVANETTLGLAATGEVLWAATRDGLLRRDGSGRWDAQRLRGAAAAFPFVNCIAAADEMVILGTSDGLRVLADWRIASWLTYRRWGTGPKCVVTHRLVGAEVDRRLLFSGLPDDRVQCVARQGDAVWAGTPGGLARGTHRRQLEELTPAPARGATEPFIPEPPEIESVKIGLLRPGEKMMNVPGRGAEGTPRLRWVDVMAVNLALEQANAGGGYRGAIPFALDMGPQGWFKGWGWTTPEDNFPELARQDDLMGIVAYLGSGARLTTAAALRTQVPLINFASTPATPDEIINPWIFRCRGDEPQRLALVLEYVFDRLDLSRVAVLRDTGTPAQRQLDWWSSAAAAGGRSVTADLRCDVQGGGLDSVLRRVQECRADVVLTWCDASRSAAILRAMRQAGMTQLLVGSEAMMTDEFVALAGPGVGSVIAVCPPDDRAEPPAAVRFVDDYRQRFKRLPTPGAFRTYEAVNHLLEAINIGGPDRDAVRHALGTMSRDHAGEQHCRHGPPDRDRAILGRLQPEGWDLCTLSDLEPANP
jgi:ABC-type branched-subunit amino acid transport system substrate-binding protein